MIQLTNNNKFIEIIKDFTKELNDAFILKGKRQLYFAKYEINNSNSNEFGFGKELLSIKGKGVVKNLVFDCQINYNYQVDVLHEIWAIADDNVKIIIPVKKFETFYHHDYKFKFEINEKIIFKNSFVLLSLNIAQSSGLIAYTLDE